MYLRNNSFLQEIVMKTFKLLAVSAILSVSANAQANGFLDLFSTSQSSVIINSGTPSGSSVSVNDPSSILGGYRVLEASGTFTNSLANASMGVGYDSGYGANILAFSSSTSATATGVVQWSGFAGYQNLKSSTATEVLGTDLLSFGNALAYHTYAVDLDAYFDVIFYTSYNQWTDVHIKTTGTGDESINLAFLDDNNFICGYVTPGFLPPAIQSVTCGSSGAVNINNTNAIELVYNTGNVAINGAPRTTALDLSIGQITSIPEPSMIGLIGMGLLAAGMASRRRNEGALQA